MLVFYSKERKQTENRKEREIGWGGGSLNLGGRIRPIPGRAPCRGLGNSHHQRGTSRQDARELKKIRDIAEIWGKGVKQLESGDLYGIVYAEGRFYLPRGGGEKRERVRDEKKGRGEERAC